MRLASTDKKENNWAPILYTKSRSNKKTHELFKDMNNFQHIKYKNKTFLLEIFHFFSFEIEVLFYKSK